MRMRNNWTQMDVIVFNSMQELGRKIAEILPDLVGALVVLVLGLLLASAVSNLVITLLRSTGVDGLLNRTPLGAKLNIFPRKRFVPSRLIGWLVKWFLILVTLLAATNILGWNQINEFLNQVLLYIPNVVIAVIILVIGFIASNFVREIVETALSANKYVSESERRFLASGADLAITLFTVMAALIQLKIATTLIQTLFTGLVFALSLALGLAFGLGGREHAARFLSRYSERADSTGGNSSASSSQNYPPMG